MSATTSKGEPHEIHIGTATGLKTVPLPTQINVKITCDPKSVRITAGQNNRLATASITLDNAFVVRNISVMNGSKGIFVNMPSQKGVDAEGNTKYFDTAFPLSKELRAELSTVVIGAYQQKLAELQNSASQRDSEPPEQDEEYSNEMF